MQHRNDPPVNKEQLSQLMDGEWHELNPSTCVKGVCRDEELRGKWARYHLIRDVIKNEPVQADNQLVSRICAAIAEEPSYSNITRIPGLVTDNTRHDSRDWHDAGDADFNLPESELPSMRGGMVASLTDSSGKSWIGTGMAGFALAASVAAVTVVGMNVWQVQSPGDLSTQGAGLAAVQQSQGVAVASAQVQGNSNVTIDGSNAFAQQVRGAPLPEVDLVANTGAYWVSPQSAERASDEDKLNLFLTQHLESSPTATREGLLPYSRLVGYEGRGQER